MFGTMLLLTACSTTLLSSVNHEEQQPVEIPTQVPYPSPVVRSATMTPTEDPESDYYKVYEQVIDLLKTDFPLRGPKDSLQWSADVDYLEDEEGQILVDANFVAGDWKIRLFDWDFKDRSDAMDVSIVNREKRFVWRGHAGSGDLFGWLTSGGLVPNCLETADSEGWLTYENHRYGYRFKYPPEAGVYELGVETFDLNDVPADMTRDEYRDHLYETIGHNVCVHLVLGDGYIMFEAPENWEGNYTFCRKLGPGAPGWRAPVRTERISVEGQDYPVEGREFIKIDGTGTDHDEALAFKLPSGMRIEFGAYSSADGSYDLYRAEVLPVLKEILESFETIPRGTAP
jgi:hypothetical protein